jgi:probable F420-dependent oxidoreductase
MRIDVNVGGSVDGTGGADLATIAEQVAAAERAGFAGVWTTEVSRDPFLPLVHAADRAPRLTLGTAVAVAFARNPMTVAVAANDLHAFSSGRFVLGLGSQVKAHIERRFSMPWSEPTARMREFVLAVRAIWSSWADRSRLDFHGEFYRHTLMTPMFTPPPNPWGCPPVLLAAVGPRMTRVAAEVADGLIAHSFTTEQYLREATLPIVADRLDRSGRGREQFTICYPGLVATGGTDEQIAAAVAAVRGQLAFYGATPAYRAVLDHHGWGALHEELHRLSVAGAWAQMAGLVDDEVLNAFAVVGAPERAGAEISRRYAGIADRFTLYTPYGLDDDVRRRVVTAAHDRQAI